MVVRQFSLGFGAAFAAGALLVAALLPSSGDSWSPPDMGCRSPWKPSAATGSSRRSVLVDAVGSVLGAAVVGVAVSAPAAATAREAEASVEGAAATDSGVALSVSGDAKKLFNEGRALEAQGNIAAAQRLYAKVTQIAPRFVYGWSNLGNTQTAFGDLDAAEESYTTAIDLCTANEAAADAFAQQQPRPPVLVGTQRCSDLYLLLLNRGSLRLNHNMPREALRDLRQSQALRARPDALVSQNLARALEVTGDYRAANVEYDAAIAMTSNTVNPFWLRAAMVKYQLGTVSDGLDLLQRVQQRFPDAPEVRAAQAVFLATQGDTAAAQQTFLLIPNRPRLLYSDNKYLTQTVQWPPAMIQQLNKITATVGDRKQ